jgi:TetR/AcrR family transcriptional regulator, regulator of cefoperazone and chloramphenicol sensitivity
MRAMVDAAVTLFAEEGYGPVSTRRIAKLAGCSETLLFRYFGGKRGLLRAIAEGFLEREDEANLPEFHDVHECVQGYLLHVFRGSKTRSGPVKVLIAALVTESELAQEFDNLHEVHVEKLAAQLRRFQDAGDIAPEIDVQAVAAGLEEMGFAVGFMMQIIYKRSQAELEAIADTFADVMAVGLRPSSAAAPISGSLRQQTVRRAREASEGLEKIVSLLESWPTEAAAPGAASKSRSRTARRDVDAPIALARPR